MLLRPPPPAAPAATTGCSGKKGRAGRSAAAELHNSSPKSATTNKMDIRETKLDLGAEEGGEGITNEPCRSWKGGGPGKEMCRRGQGLWPPRPPPLPRPRARPPRPSMPARPGAGVGAASSAGATYSTGATEGWGRRGLLHWCIVEVADASSTAGSGSSCRRREGRRAGRQPSKI